MERGTRLKLASIIVFGVCGTCSLASADEPGTALNAPPAGTAVDGTPDEAAVIVTAERRYQPAQKVPISIAALSGDDLEKSQIHSIMDVQQRVPGLTVNEASTGQNEIYIRGIGTDIVGAGTEDAVAVYVDGVYQSRSAGTAMQFLDVDRVEVLKGPQGVLYGRNATGGAINIISKAPTAENTAQFDVQAGSYNQRIVRGTVSGPLSEGVANGRLSMLYNHDDGDTRNLLLDRRGNSNGIAALRGSLALLPDAAFNVTVNAHYYQNNMTSVFKPLYPAVNPLFTVFGATVIDDPRTVMQNLPNQLSLADSGIDATAKWDLDSARLTSITALRRTDYNIKSADLDGTEVPFFIVGAPSTGDGILEVTNFFSQEFTLVSIGNDPLSWTGLLSYSHQNVDARAFNESSPLLNLTMNAVATVVTDAVGVGGQATYSWSNGLRLTGGARYSTESKNLQKDQTYFDGILTGSMTDKKTWSAVTPKVVVDYSPDKNDMLYASATKGFKSGGYNTVTIQPAFDPETAINYETGLKSKWLDGKLRLNLAAFYTKYSDMQIDTVYADPAGALYAVIQNAGKAVSKGIEASVAAQPTVRLELSGGLQFLHARFVDFVSTDPHNPALGAQNQQGNPLSRAPDFTADLAAQYGWPVADGTVALRSEGYYRSKIYYTPYKNDFASDAGLTVWNALLDYEPASETGMYGEIFVKNLSNKTYTKAIFDPQSFGYLAYFAPPRTVGVEVGYRF